MGLGGLDTALSGLRVAQQQLSVISANVSNVNTEGYTRKILPQETVSIGGQAVGVSANPIIRSVDLNLERDFWTQVSTVDALDVKSKYLDRIQQFHGPPDLEVSIAAELGQLRDSFAALADSPEDNFLQRAAVDQASFLAGKINDFASLITEMRNDTQDEMEVSVNTINTLLATIADLNGQIKFNQVSGKTTAALEDQRDQAIKTLSSEIDISFFTRGDGVLVVQTAGGVQLADEKAETLFYNRTPVGPSTFYPDPNDPEVNGIFVGGDPANNPVAIDITRSGLSGKLGALLELRDEILPQQQAMLDELAHKMALHFQQQGLTLFTDASGQVPPDSQAHVIGTVDITGGLLSPALAPNDSFSITLNPNGASPAPQTITIDLSVAEATFIPPAADGAEALAAAINAAVAALPGPFGNTVASIDANGFLNITADYDVQLSASGAGQMGDAGLISLGLSRGTTFAAPTTSPLTPVPYVGFSTEIRVNQAVLDDNRLVQQGTVSTDQPVQGGSNEVIRRVIEFVFGDVEYQEAIGTVDLRAAAVGGVTMQEWLGIYSQNSIKSANALNAYSDVNAMIAAGGEVFTPLVGPVTDTFRLTIDEPRTGLSVPPLAAGDLDFDISLNAAQLQAGTNAAEQIAAEINAQVAARVGLIPQVADLDIIASVNAYGQLIIESRGNITVDPSSFPGGMGEDGLEFLGLQAGTYATTDPYIDIQVGNDPATRVTIEPGDDETNLIAKLDMIVPAGPGVPGLAVDFTNGLLSLRPGDSTSSPSFGGDIKIVGGPFETTIPGGSGVALGSSIVAALFGNDSPVTEVEYQSRTSSGTGSFVAFRREGLGPNAAISTGIISSTNLIDFAQKMVNQQASLSAALDGQIRDETSFRDLLQRRLLDESGVNLDEELSQMIVVQMAFAAAARVITAIDEEFQELLNAFR